MSAKQPNPVDDDDILGGGRPNRSFFRPNPTGDGTTEHVRQAAHDRYANQEVSYATAPESHHDLVEVEQDDVMPYESFSLNFEEVRQTVVADHGDVDDDELGGRILQDGNCEEGEFQ